MKRGNGVERLVLVVSIAIFLDTLFYAVITPLLPQLSHQLHLSKLVGGRDDGELSGGDAGRVAARRRAGRAPRPALHA